MDRRNPRDRIVRSRGVALGSITRNTVIAIIGAIGWTYVIEGLILTQAIPSTSKWLPVGANMSITHTGDSTGLLQPGVALIVLVTWVVTFSAVAMRSILRRDV